MALEDASFAGSVIDFEASQDQIDLMADVRPKSNIQKVKKPKIYLYSGDFSGKIASNFNDEDIDGNDKFHEIFRKYLW
jgi:hypothetical protein